MKKIFIYAVLTTLTFAACTKNFEEYNTDPDRLTVVGERERPYMFAKAQSSSAMNRSFYQTVQNLGADLYAQYFALTTTTFATDRYALQPDWQRRFWTVVYVDTAPQLRSILDNVTDDSGEAALANILWVYTFHRLTDHFGPVPYFDAAKAQDVIAYDPMDEIYDDFFRRLTTAVDHLKALPSGTTVYQGYELMYDGNIEKWIAFANSLRLRLALRISKVDPARAKAEAEAAVASGVMTDNTQNASLLKSLNGNDTNGLAQVAAWNEFAMSSTIGSYLKGYADPRLSVYFQPSIANGAFNSLRNGTTVDQLGNERNQSAANSNVGTYWVEFGNGSWQPLLENRFHVMAAAESYFLRAEGALNGWNMGGDARSLYESGIETSIRQWEEGLSDAEIQAYIQSDNRPVAPGDFHNSPAVASIPVAWAATEDLRRQQIGTQKWLAVFPDGMEAWAEFRRSGFPQMYPVVASDNTDLKTGEFIKRLPYPLTEEVNNLDELTKGRALLGGPDNVATRLWWDVE